MSDEKVGRWLLRWEDHWYFPEAGPAPGVTEIEVVPASALARVEAERDEAIHLYEAAESRLVEAESRLEAAREELLRRAEESLADRDASTDPAVRLRHENNARVWREAASLLDKKEGT